MIVPRPFQDCAIQSVLDRFEATSSTLLVLPTGTGKTVVAAFIARELAKRGRIMFAAHRDFLLYQFQDAYQEIAGEWSAIERGDERSDERGWYKAQSVCTTIQTQNSKREAYRMERFNPHDFSLLIIDEAHRGAAASYRRVIDYYRRNPNLKILGMTATPDRTDKRSLGAIFGPVAYEYKILQAIKDGWLVDISARPVYFDSMDISDVGKNRQDFVKRELNDKMRRCAYAFAEEIPNRAPEGKTVVFAASVDCAKIIHDRLSSHGESSELLTGQTPHEEREEILGRFRNNGLRVLVNCMVLGEGFDVPAIQNIICARPTLSRSLYAQQVGRGMRPLPGVVDGIASAEDRRKAIAESGKPRVFVYDFVGNTGRHSLMNSVDIMAGEAPEPVLEIARHKAKTQSDKSIEEIIAESYEEYKKRRERERERRAQVRVKVSSSVTEVDPFKRFNLRPPSDYLLRTRGRCSERQAAYLRKRGVANPERLSFPDAGRLIGKMKDAGVPTETQRAKLAQFGLKCRTFDEARDLLNVISGNHWRKPPGDMIAAVILRHDKILSSNRTG